jgi:hypothetical protein
VKPGQRVFADNQSGRHGIIWLAGCGGAVSVCLLSGCHPFSQYLSPRVEGRVLDAQTHQPLPGTQVQRVSEKRNRNPAQPPNGAQLLMQHHVVLTADDGTFVVDSQKAVGLFHSVFWSAIRLSFQHDGYLSAVTNFTAANSTNTVSGEPLVKTGDVLLIPLSAKTPATNSQTATTTNIPANPIKE